MGSPIEVAYKGRIDLVTSADKAAERAILEAILSEYPDDLVLSEESSPDELADSGWIIDPLDGTTNFSRGYPFFASSIAWTSQSNQVDLGVIYNPLLKELFWAVRDDGAWCNDRRLKTSVTSTLSSALLSSGTPYTVWENPEDSFVPWRDLMTQVLALRQSGTAVLDLCNVAAGRTDAHFEVGLKPWDIAAGALLVQEAGGKVTSYDGSPLCLAGHFLLASNGILHETLVAQLSISHRPF
jgi:myo-inositol-1(or 4)-monophosphatase